MYTNIIINIIHILFIICLLLSIFINDCLYKLYSLIMIIFIYFNYITKYGKCGIINIERFFLRNNFKNGIAYKIIKPIISYKNNIFYDNNGIYLLLLYIAVLFLQLYIKKIECKTELINLINTFL